MSQAIFAMVVGAAQLGVDGPDAPPTNTDTELYSGTKIAITWTNGDTSASTQVSIDGGSTVYDTVAPGVSYYATGLTSGVVPATRHIKNGITTAWDSFA